MRYFLALLMVLSSLSVSWAEPPFLDDFFPTSAEMKLNPDTGGVAVAYSPPGFQGNSLFFGNGGRNSIHTTGLESYYNLCVGTRCLTKIEKGTYNTFGGFEAGEEIVNNSWNTGWGEATQIYNKDGNGNTSLGWKAIMGDGGSNPIAPGSWLTAIGTAAGITLTNSSYSILLGRYTMGGQAADGNDYDIVIGDAAGYDLIDGDRNIFMGTFGGRGVVDGDGNVVIGCNQNTPGISASMDKKIFLCDGDGLLRLKIDGDTLTFYKTNGTAVPVVP